MLQHEWMELEDIKLIEIFQLLKGGYCMIPLIKGT